MAHKTISLAGVYGILKKPGDLMKDAGKKTGQLLATKYQTRAVNMKTAGMNTRRMGMNPNTQMGSVTASEQYKKLRKGKYQEAENMVKVANRF